MATKRKPKAAEPRTLMQRFTAQNQAELREVQRLALETARDLEKNQNPKIRERARRLAARLAASDPPPVEPSEVDYTPPGDFTMDEAMAYLRKIEREENS